MNVQAFPEVKNAGADFLLEDSGAAVKLNTMISQVEPVSSLYAHVPFCAHKCAYCAFYSEASNGELINRYVSALVRELQLVAHDLKPRTIFFGGGTPSLLNLRQWEQILEAMDRLGLAGAEEWTVECNPATVSLEKARLLRAHGVNRVSMGVQSLNEDLLDRLGRIHSREMVFKSFDVLRAAGFDNVNIDLMFAIPGQTMAIWRETLTEALALGSEHLSSYEVIYEEDTALYEQLRAGNFEVNEELACDMYDELVARAATAGFHQYEIANFARHGEGRRPQSSETYYAPALDIVYAHPHPGPLRRGEHSPKNSRIDSLNFRTPKGSKPSAQGCEERATLGTNAKTILPPLLPLREERVGERRVFQEGDARANLSGPSPSPRPSPSGKGGNYPSHGKNVDAPFIPSFACQHNVNYWRGGSFYGLGPSAAGYVRGVRTKNWSNTRLYCEQLEKGRRAIELKEELTPLARAGEIAAFGLRMNAGWPFEEFRRVTGWDLREEWAGEMTRLVEQAWAQSDSDRFRLTPAGLRFADSAAELFLR